MYLVKIFHIYPFPLSGDSNIKSQRAIRKAIQFNPVLPYPIQYQTKREVAGEHRKLQQILELM